MVDLVLSSGFLSFAAHAGFLAAVEASGLEVGAVCGTSSGALVGGLWSAGMPAETVLALLAERPPIAWTPPSRTPWRGVFRLDPVVAELAGRLPDRFGGLARPFGAGVATVERAAVLLTSGSLAPAIAASCAVPWLFAPVAVDGVVFIDGGAVDRTALAAWRRFRPDARVLLHFIERSAGAEAEVPFGDAVVVRSPRSGGRLWSLGETKAQFEAAKASTLRTIAAQLRA